MRVCQTKYCRNIAAKGRCYCHKCIKRKYRQENPLKAAFQNLKANAKRRNKEFNLTFGQFEYFCIKTNYINKKGISSSGLHIDRIDETKGYTIDNIQVLKNKENIKKYLQWCLNSRGVPDNYRYRKEGKANSNACPF